MDELVKRLLPSIPSPVGVALGIVALLILLLPKIHELMEVWAGLRLGLRHANHAKSRLERLKLRYEIEVLKKNYSLTPLAEDDCRIDFPEGVRVAKLITELSRKPLQTPHPTKPPWKILARLHAAVPIAARLFLRTGIVFAGVLFVSCLVIGVASSLALAFDAKDPDRNTGFIGSAFFIILAAIFFLVYKYLRDQLRRLTATASPVGNEEQ